MDVGRFVTSAREAKTGSEPLTRVSMVCSVRNHFCKRTRPEDGGNGRPCRALASSHRCI